MTKTIPTVLSTSQPERVGITPEANMTDKPNPAAMDDMRDPEVASAMRAEEASAPQALAATPDVDRETIKTLLALLNPLHGDLDKQTYDEKVSFCFDAPRDHEYAVTVTAQQERDLNQAVCILESRLRNV